MRAEYAHKLRVGYGIVLGLFTLGFGAALIVKTALVYYAGAASGEQIFSREIVGRELSGFLVPAIVWLLLAVGGYVLSVLLPSLPVKKRTEKAALCRRLAARIPADGEEPFRGEYAAFRKVELVRMAAWGVCALVWVAAAIASCVYLCNVSHFTGQQDQGGVNGDVLRMLRNVLPWVGAAFLVSCGATVLELVLYARQLPRVKRLLVLGKGRPLPPPSPVKRAEAAAVRVWGSEWTVPAVRIALLLVAAVFLLLELLVQHGGGIHDVLVKAANICSECIGLG